MGQKSELYPGATLAFLCLVFASAAVLMADSHELIISLQQFPLQARFHRRKCVCSLFVAQLVSEKGSKPVKPAEREGVEKAISSALHISRSLILVELQSRRRVYQSATHTCRRMRGGKKKSTILTALKLKLPSLVCMTVLQSRLTNNLSFITISMLSALFFFLI